MNYIKGSIITILLLLQMQMSYAQEYLIEAQLITPEDGLANLLTTSIFKDADGFLWIGNQYGLNRFDGYNFQLYNKDKNGLTSDNPINHLVQDDNGLIWIYYEGNPFPFPRGLGVSYLDIFNPKTEEAVPFDTYFKDKAPFKERDICISRVNDSKNRFWITTTKGELYLYSNNQFEKVFSLKNTSLRFVNVDNEDNIWLGAERQIFKINRKGKILETIELPHEIVDISLLENNKLCIATGYLKDKKAYHKQFWIKEKNQPLTTFSFKKNGKPLTLIDKGYFIIRKSPKGFWYIEIEDQLNVFDQNGNWLANINQLIQEDLYSDALSYHFDGKYDWFTSPIGLFKISIQPNHFKLIHKFDDGFSDTRGITEDNDGNIYFSNRHLYCWSPKLKSLQQISNQKITFSLIYNDNTLWSSVYGGNTLGIKLDLRTKEVVSYPEGNSGSLAFAALHLNKHNFLLGLKKGLKILDLENDTILPFHKYNEFDILKESWIYHLVKHNNDIWIASSAGVFQMNEKQGVVKHYNSDSGDLPFNHIRFIHIDKDGIFWLGTKGGGIIRWKPNSEKAKKYKQITTSEGLSNDYIYAIYEDDYNHLWASSDRGVMCMNKKDLSVRTFLEKDGLPHVEFNVTSHYQSNSDSYREGTIYFGGLGGLISFHPKDFQSGLIKNAPLRFTGYYVQEDKKETISDRTITLNNIDKITIKPSDKFFELQFALLDFDNPKQHQYAYKIEGYSNKWNFIDENFIRLTGLPYGIYTLRIKGQNINNTWSENELRLKIHVKRPFYLTGVFILSLVGLLALSIWFYFRYRTIQLQKRTTDLENEVKTRTAQIRADKQTIEEQAEALKKLDKAKTRFFSNITHELRTPLTLIIGPMEQLIHQTTNAMTKKRMKGIQKNAQHLLDLINQMLDLSKLESGQMKQELMHGDIVAYTQELVNRFRPLANKKNIRIGLVANKVIWNTYFDKDKWNKIIYNLLSNAIKFTAVNGAVQITLMHKKESTESIFFEIKDTGRGIREEELKHIFDRFYQTEDSEKYQDAGTGIGLALVKELVGLLNGTIHAYSEIGKGTTFQISLPIINEASPIETIPATFDNIPFPIVSETLAVTKKEDAESEPLQLLIIDDNEEIREYIRYCIDTTKYKIHEAKDGEEGIQMARNIIPDLIISDIMMPKKNGYEVAHAIRSHISTSHIPLILLTAKAALENRLEGLARGADAYLTKPFSPNELVLRIQKLIEIRQLLQVRYANTSKLTYASKLQNIEQEDEFILSLKSFIRNNLDSQKLTGEGLSKEFAMSRMQLYRKVKALTNQSLSEIIKGVRMETAMNLIQQRKFTISEIAYQTGFSTPSHFSKTFKKVYGKSPSEV